MEYRVIIALNSTGKRKVGEIISLFEKKGLEFIGIEKVKRYISAMEFPNIKTLILENQLNEVEAMEYYKSKFTLKVLRRKLQHFKNNHVELIFESGDNVFESELLWESLKSSVFMNGRKLPIMFVLTDKSIKFDEPIIDDNFKPLATLRIPDKRLNPRLGPSESQHIPRPGDNIPLGPNNKR